MLTATLQTRLDRLWGRSTDAALIEALLSLDAEPRNPDRSWARTRVIDELERRHPTAAVATAAAVDAALEQQDSGEGDERVNYVDVLVAHLRAATAG